MALGGHQVIHLVRLDLLKNSDQIGRIGQIAVMENKIAPVYGDSL